MLKSILKLFGSRKQTEPADMSALGVDMHSHLIPGIDDGAKTIEDSIELIRGLQSLGYRKLITTPHIMSDYFRNTPEIINEGLQNLKKALIEAGINIEIEAAAEYYIDDGFVKKMEEGPLLSFGDKHILIEVSYINPPESIHSIIFRAQTMGYKPVLAHPERYPYWYRDMETYRRFYEMGVTLQLNMNSLAGYYGPDAKQIAEKMIDMDIIGAVGTDLHHQRHADCIQRVIHEKYLHKLLDKPLLNREL